jgi:ribosomal protein S18 acetylase RimI-like enzyme
MLPEHVAGLRLSWAARMQPDEVRRLLTIYPGRSVWTPKTLEYALVGPWRHREEIAHLVDLSAVRHPGDVIDAVLERCVAAGDALLLSVEMDEVRRPIYYERIDFSLLEEIVTYEWRGGMVPGTTGGHLRFVPVDASDDRIRSILLAIDHTAFPWLWWNSELEFQAYGLTPGVELFLGFDGEEPAAYVGTTSFPGWGHLDRIAVIPEKQGRGLGLTALSFAVDHLVRRGARRVGLSTQGDNLRSRRIYERFGFRRFPSNDYRLYGHPLLGEAEIALRGKG